jgi:glutamate N-acetyltransferase / amino-acid N-acetyltransferase
VYLPYFDEFLEESRGQLTVIFIMSVPHCGSHLLQPLKQSRSQWTRLYSTPAGPVIPAAKKKYVPTSGDYPKGFRASGVLVGVKPGNTTKPDLAFITSDTPCAAAAVFTKNKFQAAPVVFSRDLIQKKRNKDVRSVIINSGCANAVTGKGGMEDAAKMAKRADACVGSKDSTIVMSTGVIGQRYAAKRRGTSLTYTLTGSQATHSEDPRQHSRLA